MMRQAIVADVGRSHTALALAEPGPDRPVLKRLHTVPTPNGRLRQLLADYQRSIDTSAITACAVSAAGRIRRLPGRTWVSIANAHLTIDRDDLCEATGANTGILVNELAAVAAALPLLRPDELLPVGPVRNGAGGPSAHAVIGIGMGFGVAALTADGGLLESEAGHADLAAVSAEERQWLNRIAPLGRLTAEMLLSSKGLGRLYEANGGSPSATPTDIAQRAGMDEPQARKTVTAYSRWLGRVVGNMVLLYGSWGGVYLTGDVLDALDQRFDTHAFREGMEDKAPFSPDLSSVPVYRIRHAVPALLGLANLVLSR